MLSMGKDGKKRCFGNKAGEDYYAHYHDTQWGVSVYDDRLLFEFLLLESAQAGLSWTTILKKREGYRKSFHDFDPVCVANMTDTALEDLRYNPEIIRNRLKINSARTNAQAFLNIQEKYGSFSMYLWAFVDGKSIVNSPKSLQDIPITTPISDALSKSLKAYGMTFVGSTIIYAYMQAVGMVNDHVEECWLRDKSHIQPPSSTL